MKIKNIKTLFALIGFIFLSNLGLAQEDVAIPKLERRVTDLTQTLSTSDVRFLEEKLARFEEIKGSQITVLILPTTQPETIEQYSIRLAEAWKIGRGKIDDGVILLVAKDDRKLRIEVGYGLEGAIPDIYAKRIIENMITPEFRHGQFAGGINKGLDAIMGLIEGEDLPVVTKNDRGSRKARKGLSVGLIVIGLIVLSVLKGMVKSSPMKFVVAIAIAILLGIIFTNIVLGIISLIFSLLIFFGNSSGGGGGGGGYYGGGYYGGSGGGFSSGGGFGGFSGGGGGFGGGGASGGW